MAVFALLSDQLEVFKWTNRFIDTSMSSSDVDFRAMFYQIGAATDPSPFITSTFLSNDCSYWTIMQRIPAVDFVDIRIFHSQVVCLNSKGKRRKTIPLFNLFLIHPLVNWCLLPRVNKVDKVFTDGTTHILENAVSFVQKKKRESPQVNCTRAAKLNSQGEQNYDANLDKVITILSFLFFFAQLLFGFLVWKRSFSILSFLFQKVFAFSIAFPHYYL